MAVVLRTGCGQEPRAPGGSGIMDESKFNMSVRKYLKQVGVTSQRAIEEHVRENGLTGGTLKVTTVLTVEGQDLQHVVEGAIELD